METNNRAPTDPILKSYIPQKTLKNMNIRLFRPKWSRSSFLMVRQIRGHLRSPSFQTTKHRNSIPDRFGYGPIPMFVSKHLKASMFMCFWNFQKSQLSLTHFDVDSNSLSTVCFNHKRSDEILENSKQQIATTHQKV